MRAGVRESKVMFLAFRKVSNPWVWVPLCERFVSEKKERGSMVGEVMFYVNGEQKNITRHGVFEAFAFFDGAPRRA